MSDGMENVFRLVAGLWISPDFSEVVAGRGQPRPSVDHDAIDYPGLVDFLERHFYCGEHVVLRLPNDTVDHVTVHARMRGTSPELARCHDFAEQLLDAAVGGRNPISIRHAWEMLHRHKDRRRAPPPVLFMFMIEGAFEAVTIWHAQASMRLGIRAADLSVLLSGRMKDSDHDGRLTDELSAELERQFGVPYQRRCQLAKMVSSPPPSWSTNAAAAV
jgi:hypothetical protein